MFLGIGIVPLQDSVQKQIACWAGPDSELVTFCSLIASICQTLCLTRSQLRVYFLEHSALTQPTHTQANWHTLSNLMRWHRYRLIRGIYDLDAGGSGCHWRVRPAHVRYRHSGLGLGLCMCANTCVWERKMFKMQGNGWIRWVRVWGSEAVTSIGGGSGSQSCTVTAETAPHHPYHLYAFHAPKTQIEKRCYLHLIIKLVHSNKWRAQAPSCWIKTCRWCIQWYGCKCTHEHVPRCVYKCVQ